MARKYIGPVAVWLSHVVDMVELTKFLDGRYMVKPLDTERVTDLGQGVHVLDDIIGRRGPVLYVVVHASDETQARRIAHRVLANFMTEQAARINTWMDQEGEHGTATE